MCISYVNIIFTGSTAQVLRRCTACEVGMLSLSKNLAAKFAKFSRIIRGRSAEVIAEEIHGESWISGALVHLCDLEWTFSRQVSNFEGHGETYIRQSLHGK